MNLAERQKQFWQALRAGELPIYSDMYFWRQIDALREDFPQTAERSDFEEVARQYILDHPSEDPDLGRLGRLFGTPLERARNDVFLEAEVPRMKPEDFGQRLSVQIAPALRLVDQTVVWRTPNGYDLNEVDLERDEVRALQAAIDGATFEQVCECFGEPARAFEALQSWLAEGWIAS